MPDLNKQELRRLAHEASETECQWLDRNWLASIMAEDWADYLVALEPVAVIALLDENDALQADAACVGDLSMLVRQLVQALRKAAPDHALPEKALDYLKRKGLQGSPLRAERNDAHELAARAIYQTWANQPGFVPWVEGGNSLMQEEARRMAMRKESTHA